MKRPIGVAIVVVLGWVAAATAATHTITSANLRSSPVQEPSTLMRTLPANTEVAIQTERVVDGVRWAMVSTGTELGWIRADLIAGEPAAAAAAPPISEPPAVEPPPPAVEPAPAGLPAIPAAAPAEAPAAIEPEVETEAEPAVPAAAQEPIGEIVAPFAGEPAPLWLVALRDTQVLLAAIFLSFPLLLIGHRLGRRLTPDPEYERRMAAAAHVDAALVHEGIRREYDRLLYSMNAIERLLLPNGSGRSVLEQLTELVASMNTADEAAQRAEVVAAIRKRMIESGLLPAFGHIFGGLPGYTFSDQLRDHLQAFLTTDDAASEARFEGVREPTKLCFDDLASRVIPDVLQGGAMTFLFSRRPELIEAARRTARKAASRGWSLRDLVALRQTIVHDLFAL